MTAADWAANTLSAFAHQPPRRAARSSAAAFADGLAHRLRLARLKTSRTPTYRTTILGQDLTFLATGVTDIKRARSLNGELPAAAFLSAGIDDGTRFWDVGSYHGHYAVLMAALGADAVAFEPGRESVPRIRQHAALNGLSVPVYTVALSDRRGRAALGGPSPNQRGVNDVDVGDRVTTRRGDTITPAPDVVKIDVEGHEQAVLDGLSGHLPGIQRVLVEVHDSGDAASVRERLRDTGMATTTVGTDRAEVHVGGYRP